MNNGKQPITPIMYTKCGDGEDDYQPLKDGQKTGCEVKFGGLTKREYFALHLMQGLLSGAGKYSPWNYENLSKISIQAADSLLVELSNGDGQ